MGKSPGKWIKTLLFGKKTSKSNLSKDAALDKKTSITTNPRSKNFGAIIDVSREHTQLEKSSGTILTHDIAENVRSTLRLDTATHDELTNLERAATKAQAAFRGYLARRAFCALKGIIRLQALVRGHLVRRQAVATLSCMRAIVEFQALVRGQKVRLSGNFPQILQKKTQEESVHMEQADLLQTSLRSEKLSTNAFATKLVASSNITTPLSIQYDPDEPNSVRNWLERWSSSHFWEPLVRPKKTLNVKTKRKQIKLQYEETETGKPKRSVRRVPAVNLDNNPSNSSEKRTAKKVLGIPAESVQEQPHSELERVKHTLRKISLGTSGKSEAASEKLPDPSVSEQCPDQSIEKEPESEALPAPPLEVKPVDVNSPIEPPPPTETDWKVDHESPSNVESNGKENQKTRRRKSFPAKQEHSGSISQNAPVLPSYMAATESAKAKLRAQVAEDEAENSFVRRHSLPSSIQKPLLANGKGASNTNKPQISSRYEKAASAGWRR